MNRNFLKLLSIVSLIVFVASCKVTQPYQTPEVRTEGLFRNANVYDTNTIANLKWNEVFTDPDLQRLIQQGINSNLDLQIAFTRIQQAQAYYRQSGAAFLPTLNSNVSVTESKLSAVQGFGIRNNATQFQLGLSSAWEADIWGRLASSRRASFANLLQSEAGARAVQTSIVGTIANFYYSLLALDQQLAITEQTVRNWDTPLQQCVP